VRAKGMAKFFKHRERRARRALQRWEVGHKQQAGAWEPAQRRSKDLPGFKNLEGL